MKCRACSCDHQPWVRCEVAARIAGPVKLPSESMANAKMANADVANTEGAEATTYRYRDAEARRVYQRELMRARRAKARVVS